MLERPWYMPRKVEYVSAVRAASITGLSEKTIRRMIERGQLKAEKRGQSYAIKVTDLDTLTGQRPPTLDTLLHRIQELESTSQRQAETISAQAEQIAELERRIQAVEQHQATSTTRPLPNTTRPLAAPQPAPFDTTSSESPPDEDRTPTAPLPAPPGLPPGSVLVAHFARAHGQHPRTMNDQVRAGRIQATTIDRGGRAEHWLAPAQQYALILQWQTEGRPFSPCPQCPHTLALD
jgi:excisionase family DNA binding protein